MGYENSVPTAYNLLPVFNAMIYLLLDIKSLMIA